MKKLFLVIFSLTIFAMTSQAGEQRINLYCAYAFDDEISSTYDSYNYYHGQINAGVQYGAGLEFITPSQLGVELLWIGQNTDAPLHYMYTSSIFERSAVVDLSLNYAM